jgi:hypothetical protein
LNTLKPFFYFWNSLFQIVIEYTVRSTGGIRAKVFGKQFRTNGDQNQVFVQEIKTRRRGKFFGQIRHTIVINGLLLIFSIGHIKAVSLMTPNSSFSWVDSDSESQNSLIFLGKLYKNHQNLDLEPFRNNSIFSNNFFWCIIYDR